MFDIGLPEMLVLVVVTLLVVGPKDLPRVIRGFARAIARMRRMVDEFLGNVNEYVRESELAEFKEAMDKTRAAVNPNTILDDYIDPAGDLRKAGKPAAKPSPSTTPEIESGESAPAEKPTAPATDSDKQA